MISDVVAGVLVEAIGAAGRRLGAAAVAVANRRRGGDLEIARWFDTYRLTSDPPELPDLSPDLSEQLAGFLRSNEVQAVLHELLAARLTDAPETDVERIRAVFDLTLNAEQPELGGLGEVLFGYYDGQICDLTGRLEGTQPAMLAQVRAEALAARMIAILGAIERHAAALSLQPGRQTEAGFLARYRRHVIEHHGKIDPPDFERRRRVPIAELYVPPAIVEVTDSEPLGQPRKSGHEIDLWTLAGVIDRTVLLGDPGGGKTTSANVLMHYHVSKPGRRVPFLVTLREFAAADPPERSVAGHIEYKLETFYQCPAPPGLVSRLLLTGAGMVIFDGLDELLDAARRVEVTAIVERFCAEYPLAPVLVTSRQVGYDQARLDDRHFTRYRIGGFGDDQVSDYVRKWFAQDESLDASEADRSAGAFMDESASVPDLRTNPLMLALMCILYRGEGSLPRDRAEVYEQCAALLFRKWDARRRIHQSLQAGPVIEPALRHLAWWLFNRGQAQPAATERELVEETSTFLRGHGFESDAEARQAAQEFAEFCRGRMWVLTDTGTTAQGEALYSFTHRTFLEYFSAAHLAYDCDTPERLARVLAPRVARHQWDVVGELAVQIKDRTSSRGAQRVYAALLAERRRRSAAGRGGVLEFLARCLRSVDPTPGMVRALAQEILDYLFCGDINDPARSRPLCWLLACCDRRRDVVSEEISARIAQMTEAADPGIRLNGMRLAAFLPFAVLREGSEGGPGLAPDTPIRNFWWARTTELIRTHADTAASAATDDWGMRFAALWWRVITLDQALRMPGGATVLFKGSPGISRNTWAAYLPNCVHWINHAGLGAGSRVAELTDDLATFGRYLLDHPEPPWIEGPIESLEHYLLADDRDGSSKPGLTSSLSDPTAYLGAAAVVLIAVESLTTREMPTSQRNWRLGPLSNLNNHLTRRWNMRPSSRLTNLPVPDPFRKIFRDWADNKINLIAPAEAAYSECQA
jgi:hypothetical protein